MKARERAPVILGCGMMTAVGLSASASAAAIRAGITGFIDTRFMVLGGTYIQGAPVPLPERRLRGVHRLAHLVAGAIAECLVPERGTNTDSIPLLLGIAETMRPGRLPDLDTGLLPQLEEVLNVKFHRASRVLPMGRVACGVGLRDATRLLNEEGFRRVIVAGVDSYLMADTIKHMDEFSRLLTDRNSNGFIPGEAGAALLVGLNEGDSGHRICSLGFGVESATVGSEHPLRGDGLTDACRGALADAGIGMHDVDYRIASCSGEQYWFRESALAVGRLTRVRKEFQDFWHPADCIGEIGAAAIPCMIGVNFWAARKAYAPGPLSLLHASNDDGRRAAIVMEYR